MKTSLYVHFPFCVRKCLLKEMDLRRQLCSGEPEAETLYIGGGTPSLLNPRLVSLIIEMAARLFALDPAAEITLEANPGTISREKLAGYRSAGINRLSLGVQSFSDPLLVRLGRVHDAREALAAFAAARESGFADIGIDLIHSLPGQDPEMWHADLERAVMLQPEHISAYALSVEEGTPFHLMERRGELALPCEENAARMFEMTDHVLRECGYEHYEISNFSLPGRRSRHNMNYWRRGSYLGFGAGAHSFQAVPPFGRRWKNRENPEHYLGALAEGIIPEEDMSSVTEREAMGETLFLGLRMLDGIDTERFRLDFGLTPGEAYPAEMPALLANGLLEEDKGRLRLSRHGVILANQVFVKFV